MDASSNVFVIRAVGPGRTIAHNEAKAHRLLSKLLKVGDRVCFNGEQSDRGVITATQARYVTIKWDDGHQSFSSHNEMKRVERVLAHKSK